MTPSLGPIPSITLLSLILSFIFCPTSFWRIWKPFWVPGALRQCSEVILWKLLSIQMTFWWICGGETSPPIQFLHHLLLINFSNSLLHYPFISLEYIILVLIPVPVWLLFSRSVMSDYLWPPWNVAHQVFLSFTISQSLLNSYSLIWWCHPTISSSVVPFSSCLQFFLTSGSFLMNWLFTSGGQIIRVSSSASVLIMNIQGWFPLGLTGLVSSQSKGLSRVFSSTTVWKHQLFGAQLLV